jgi:NAD(P)-dependent dehydrogenase (short-subunit alcohol dehydrogenase family)
MGALEGRVSIITGAGRGIGREHALLFASEGALVVVNDFGGNPDGSGSDSTPAAGVVAEIEAAGGRAVANTDDVTSEEGARHLVESAVDVFGRLDVLVNNAGILRDRMMVNMSPSEWDDVIRVHLRGHFLPTHFAARHWRDRSKAGEKLAASVINTSSTSGLFGLAGQTNYGAAKMGIAAFTIIAQMELGRYGVRLNAIAPAARTRLTSDIPGSEERERVAQEAVVRTGWDPRDPANISPFVGYLATEHCPMEGRVFFVRGGQIQLLQPFSVLDGIEKVGRWSVAELEEKAGRLASIPLGIQTPSVASPIS